MEAPRKSAGPPAFLQVSPMLQLWIELAFFSLPLSRAEQKGLCQRLAENPVRKSDHPSSSRQDARPKCSAIAGPFLPSAEYWILAFSKIPCAAETKKYFDRSQLPASVHSRERRQRPVPDLLPESRFSGSRGPEELAVMVSVQGVAEQCVQKAVVLAECERAKQMAGDPVSLLVPSLYLQ